MKLVISNSQATFLIQKVAEVKVQQNFQIKMLNIKKYVVTVLLKRFHLNNHNKGLKVRARRLNIYFVIQSGSKRVKRPASK